ncbi:aldehyde reductase ii [Fusarium sporotrichioides]|uniref:Aldehyde reductase ii n=1 Tax=Fusarium sporotrichioides TaxID=5514 RepID=A0A395RVY6_FUSSP|nr:aldehyde reductase ii [Fusarium sporotrichioides]
MPMMKPSRGFRLSPMWYPSSAYPEKVIPIAVNSALIAIKAVYREPSVKRFVLTSSSVASLPVDVQTLLNMNGTVLTEDSWSHDAQRLVWIPEPWGPEHGFPVYCASKVEQEQAVWKYHKDNQTKLPDIVVNTGTSLDPVNQSYPSSSGLIPLLFEGKELPVTYCKPQYGIDIQDSGLLQAASAILPDVKGERIFGFAQAFCWNDALEILRKQYPNRTYQENFAGIPFPAVVIKPRYRGGDLLERLGKPDTKSLRS